MASAFRSLPFSLYLFPLFASHIIEKDIIVTLKVRGLPTKQYQMLSIRMCYDLMSSQLAWRLFLRVGNLFPNNTWQLHLLGSPRHMINIKAPQFIQQEVLWSNIPSIYIVLIVNLSQSVLISSCRLVKHKKAFPSEGFHIQKIEIRLRFVLFVCLIDQLATMQEKLRCYTFEF